MSSPTTATPANGYDKYSGWLSCSRHFFFLRQFRKLNVRVLLAMQDEIVELEEDLKIQDERLRTNAHNGSFRDIEKNEEYATSRHETLWAIQTKLKLYNEHWAAFQNVADRPRVKRWDIESVENWHCGGNNGSIKDEEIEYRKRVDDLVYVLPPLRQPPLERLVSKCFSQESEGMDDKTTPLNKQRARRILNTILIPFALFMLIGPLWILNILPDTNSRLGGITGFVLLLALYLSLGTTAKTEVVWGTIAAYSAVLMVFLQIQNSNR